MDILFDIVEVEQSESPRIQYFESFLGNIYFICDIFIVLRDYDVSYVEYSLMMKYMDK